MSLEGMRLNRSIKMKWFTLDFNPYQRVRLFTGLFTTSFTNSFTTSSIFNPYQGVRLFTGSVSPLYTRQK